VYNSLDQYKEVWAVDFEFIARPGEKLVPVCLSAQELRSGRQVLLWQDQLGSAPPYDLSSDSLFIAYYASAELNCHRSLGWKQPQRILDLYVEFKNLTNGLPVMNGKGLLGALAYYGLGAIDATEKTEMRDLVLRGGPWAEEEKATILEYCKSDTDSLARLLVKMLHHEVDAEYGVYEGRSFRQERFEEWLCRNDIGWPRLDSGKLALDDDTFEEMANIYPQLVNLRKLRQALSELRLNNLQVGGDGFNRTLLSPFGSITGRNQPSNTKYIWPWVMVT
jgi:DNA polymerase I